MKKVAILQSNYIPWKGYFDIIHSVDEFILYDDMQYTRRDWRNRNKIMTKDGLKWLTIPVNNKGRFFQKIKEVTISEPNWAEKHWKTICYNYAHSRYFDDYEPLIASMYEKCAKETYLSRINYFFLVGICKILGITTRITWSYDYPIVEGKTARLVGLVQAAGGDYYLSGPAAKDYIEEKLFREARIELAWMDYSKYPVYHQLGAQFEHGVSILDLIFNEGPKAPQFIWGDV